MGGSGGGVDAAVTFHTYEPLCLLVVLSNISMASSTCGDKSKG